MDAPQKGGQTGRQAIKVLLERNPDREDLMADLRGPEFPAVALYLYRWHSEIRRRVGGGFGPGPIGWPDIEAWSRLSRHRLNAWEASVIADLDDIFVRVMGEALAP